MQSSNHFLSEQLKIVLLKNGQKASGTWNLQNLTTTAGQTHLCRFTFTAPKPVLALSFHYLPVRSFIKKNKKDKIQPMLSSSRALNKCLKVSSVIQCLRITYPRKCVYDGISSNERSGGPCCPLAVAQIRWGIRSRKITNKQC